MICPRCAVELRVADRQGIEVDYCPQCRGVWLDRGELDKIIERSNAYRHHEDDDDDDDDDRRRYRQGPPQHYPQQPPPGYPPPPQDPPRKREGFFSRLFDFD